MKKTFTLILSVLSFGLFSQNFSVYQVNNSQSVITATVTQGYTITQNTSITTNTASPSKTEFKIKLVNNSASTVSLSVIRRIVYHNPALLLNGGGSFPDSYFCFGFQCFPSNIYQPTAADFCVLGPSGSTVTPFDNSKDNGTPFVIDLIEGLTLGKYFVNYNVYNVANPADSVSFLVKYNEFLNVNEMPGLIESSSDVYPNPTTNNAFVTINLKQESAVKTQVFNSLGSLVINNTDQKFPQGKNKISVDCSALNQGIYFMCIDAGGSKITKRLIIHK